MKRESILVCLLSLFCSLGYAQNEATVNADDGLNAANLLVFGEVGVGHYKISDTDDALVISPAFELRYHFGSNLAIAADWGFSHISVPTTAGDETAFALGNPFLSGHLFVHTWLLKIDFGLGASIPVARTDGEDVVAPLSLVVAAASRGYWSPWLWLPDHWAMAAPFRIEVDLPLIMAALDGAAAMFVSTEDSGQHDVLLQSGAELGLNLGFFQAGLRTNLIWLPEGDAAVDYQFSLEPFTRLDFDTVFVDARAVFNVGGPVGWSFNTGGVFGWFVGAGFNL